MYVAWVAGLAVALHHIAERSAQLAAQADFLMDSGKSDGSLFVGAGRRHRETGSIGPLVMSSGT